jgi:hypothetical protein
MRPMKGLIATIRDLITIRKEQLSSLHVMLHWVEVELNKVVSRMEARGDYIQCHDSKLDDETKGRLKMLVSALEMSPIDMKKVDEFDALLTKKTTEIPVLEQPSRPSVLPPPPPPARVINAKEAVERFGDTLIGQVIYTEPLGKYPGGPATVVQINPDIGAPDIVLNVKHPDFTDGSEMGVFEYEDIGVKDTEND